MPHRPLEPLGGNLWLPSWAIRPGSYTVIAQVAAEMPLWLLLHSRNGDRWKPSFHNREQLGATLGVGPAKISRHLAALREIGLLFEVAGVWTARVSDTGHRPGGHSIHSRPTYGARRSRKPSLGSPKTTATMADGISGP